MLDVHGLFELNKLKNLQMRSNRLTEIPDNISKLHSLQCLDCSLNEIRVINKLPSALHTFKLRAGQGPSLTINSNIGNTCRRMKHLDLSNNHIDSKNEAMDNEIGVLSTVSQMTKLTYLNVEGNDINTIPSTFSNLTNLKTCIMKNNNINAHSGVPLTSLPRIEHLDIDNNAFHSIFTISIKSMKYISARANCIVSLPERMAPEILEELYLDDNELNDISNVKFNSMAKLRVLSLRNNHLQTIPDSLGRVFNLETLDLEGQKLSRAVDLVTERFDSQKWKLLAQFLGIQTEAIDRERISVKDKLRTMVQAWSEKHQAPALIPMMKDKLVQALRVVGDAQLANDIEHISVQNWTL
ncbi:leucine-rich repeat-containing protein 40-like [Saccoglossus kowalevskii]